MRIRTLAAINLSDVDYWLPNMPGGCECWVKHFADPDFQGYSIQWS